jgi:hypothetical protein
LPPPAPQTPKGPVTIDGIEFSPPPKDYVAPDARRDSERRLLMTESEVKLLPELGPLAAKSPRAVKRMMNIYRLMRVRLSGAALVNFVSGADGKRPGFRAVAFVLACEVGLHPSTVSAIERLVLLTFAARAPLADVPATSALTPFANVVDEAWLTRETFVDAGAAVPPVRTEGFKAVKAVAEGLAAEGKIRIFADALATAAATAADAPPGLLFNAEELADAPLFVPIVTPGRHNLIVPIAQNKPATGGRNRSPALKAGDARGVRQARQKGLLAS